MARRQSLVPVLVGLGVVAYLAKQRAAGAATILAGDDEALPDRAPDAALAGYRDNGLGFVPAVAAIATPYVTNYVQNLFGGGARDAARKERAQFFTEYAQSGSVLAARYLYGGMKDVASNERPYYQQGIQQLESANPAVAQEAARLGSQWIGSDDPQAPTSQQRMIQNVLADQSPLTHAVNTVGGALTGAGAAASAAVAGIPPVVLMGGVALLAVVLAKRGR